MATKQPGILTRTVAGILNGLRTYGWILIAGSVGALAIGAISERESTRIVAVAPYVEPLEDGENLLEPEEILSLLAENFTVPLHDLRLSDIDVERVEEVLERQAFVGDAEAYVDADMVLHVAVRQRIPLLRIVADNGQNYYLDLDGVRLPLSENYTVRVPVVTGEVVVWTEDYQLDPDHQLSQLMELGHYLRADAFLAALIEQIDINDAGELTLAPKVGDQTIKLGRYDESQTPLRLQRLKTFYREGLPYEGWRKYRSFDLRYADQVVAKKA